jgi:hypothetical protein
MRRCFFFFCLSPNLARDRNLDSKERSLILEVNISYLSNLTKDGNLKIEKKERSLISSFLVFKSLGSTQCLAVACTRMEALCTG